MRTLTNVPDPREMYSLSIACRSRSTIDPAPWLNGAKSKRDSRIVDAFWKVVPRNYKLLPINGVRTGHNLRREAKISKLRDQCRISRNTQVAAAREMSEVVETREKEEKYVFGPWKIDAREVFLTTEHCYCFVNLRPVVPGHVLVATKRLVPRFTDLTLEEVTDIWVTAQKVGQTLEPFFKATSLTLAIQDGPESGQTVPHVHVHILPRKKEDFENNDVIYDELENKEKELNEAKKEEEKHLNLDEERKDRTRQEMFEEASELRALFQ